MNSPLEIRAPADDTTNRRPPCVSYGSKPEITAAQHRCPLRLNERTFARREDAAENATPMICGVGAMTSCLVLPRNAVGSRQMPPQIYAIGGIGHR